MAKRVDTHFTAREDVSKAAAKAAHGVTGLNKTVQSAQRAFRNSTLAIGAAIAAMYTVGKAVGDLIEAYNAQEQAEARLMAAIRVTGREREISIEGLKEYAAELQKTTTFGDEATLSAMAMLQQLGNLDEQGLRQVTPLVQDFAAAMGVDLQTAASLVGKTLGSSTNALSRYGVNLDATAPPTEKLAALTAALEQKFGGMAAALGETFQGKMDRLKNAWGDIKEILGKFLAEEAEPVITWLLDFLTNAQNIQVITRIVRAFGAMFATVFNYNVVLIKTVINAYRLWANAVTHLWEILKVVFNPREWGSGKIKEELANLANTTVEIARQVVEDWGTHVEKVLKRWGTVFGDAGEEVVKTVRNTYQLASGTADETAAAVENVATVYQNQIDKLTELNRAYVDYKSELELAAEAHERLMETQDEQIPEVIAKLNEMNRTWEYTGLVIGEAEDAVDHYADLMDRVSSILANSFERAFGALGEILVNAAEGWASLKEAAKDAVSGILRALGQKALGEAADALAEMIKAMAEVASGNVLAAPGVAAWAASAAKWGAAAALAFAGAGAVKGLAGGGWLTEPVLGRGLATGQRYLMAEAGPEYVGRPPVGMTVNVQGSIISERELARQLVKAQRKVGRGW